MKRISIYLIIILLAHPILAIEYLEARHLLSRTGFGGSPAEIEKLLPLSYEEAVQTLIDGMTPIAFNPPPEWVNESHGVRKQRRQLLKSLDQEQRRTYRMMANRQWRQRAAELQAWWYREMISTPSPLTERMTLFWHNHFTSGIQKVRDPLLMYRQNLLLRRYARGNFRDFVQAIAKDPAMILYLDNQTNRKGKPNENFARELLELFTLGEGHYSERDIKEAARGFTGWMVHRLTGEFQFNHHHYDDGTKNFMGHSGNFSGGQIVDIILQQPRAAEFIVEKLWREFISTTPDKREVERLAAVFRESNYELAPLLKALFTSPHFRNPEIYGSQIKSPVELIVGTVRMFQVPVPDTRQLVQYGRQLGQVLFNPPNVKGWPGGKMWITTSTLLTRRLLLQRTVRGRDMFIERFWVWHYFKDGRKATAPGLEEWMELDKERKHRKVSRILLPIEPVQPIPEEVDTPAVIQHLLMDLSYQLK